MRAGSLGTRGTAARVAVGIALIGWAVALGVDATDALAGLVVLPGLATLVLLAVRRRDARPLRLDAGGHLLTLAIVVVLSAIALVPTLLFYGSTMLVAAATGNGGCEVTSVSNWLRGRRDRVGCPLFAPIDALDARERTLQ